MEKNGYYEFLAKSAPRELTQRWDYFLASFLHDAFAILIKLLDTFFYQLQLSVEYHEWVSFNDPTHGQTFSVF